MIKFKVATILRGGYQEQLKKERIKMKKEYISLELELVYLDEQDIVTMSKNDIVGDDIFND